MQDSTMRATKWLPGAALLMLASLQLQAADGSYEINQACVAVGCFSGDAPGFPVSISAPGKYTLSSDVTVSSGTTTNAIEIQVSRVDLDLNGHMINGGGSCTGTPVSSCSGFQGGRAVQISGSGVFVVHVHNGTIRGFGDAALIGFGVDSGTQFDHLVVTENLFGALLVGDSDKSAIRIDQCSFTRNGATALGIANNVYADLRITNSVFAGNRFNAVDGGDGSTFTDNVFSDNGGFGIICYPTASSICALGRNAFQGNNGGGAAAQWSIHIVRDMVGNVCLDDGNCP